MIEAILNWVFSIAVFLILITLFLQLLPERFKKYLNFYTGVLLMLIAIKPVTGLFKIDSDIVSYFELGEMELKLRDISDSLSLTRNVTGDRLINEYNLLIREGVEKLIDEYGYTATAVSVEWNLDENSTSYGTIKNISATLNSKRTGGSVSGIKPVSPIVIGEGADEENQEIIEIKSKLADFYKIRKEHININVQG